MENVLMIEEMEEVVDPNAATLAGGIGAGILVGIGLIALLGCGGC